MTSTAIKLTEYTTANTKQLAETMFGDGVTVLSAIYSGDDLPSCIYTGGSTVSPNVVPTEKDVIFSTGRATDLTNASGNVNKLHSTSIDFANDTNSNGEINVFGETTSFSGKFRKMWAQ